MMARLLVCAASLWAVGVLSGCAGGRLEQNQGLSPRPACASFTALIYFQADSADLLPSATPILRDVVDRIEACQAAGGELSRIRVTAFPDRSGGRQERRYEVGARARTARTALIIAGAPRSAISIQRPGAIDDHMMQRRAEISIEMW